jgi:chemotaxis response regulator CheB
VLAIKTAVAKAIKVLIVDDSALIRKLLTEIINRQPDMVAIGAASDPLVAREMIRERNPDVLTLDVEMPRMDGLEFLEKLMALRPMPVVMVSTLTERLDKLCRIVVKEAVDGERVLPGHAYIAPGGFHLALDRSGANYVTRILDTEPINRYKPSVEVLFKSAAKHAGHECVGCNAYRDG